MAQKRVNKNLVLFLTFMGIVLSVSVVAVATYQGSRKDPEVYAADAQKAEAAGNRPLAIERYIKAYDARKEVKYLVSASQNAYELGEISQAITILVNAHAQDPNDKGVLEKMLNYMWDLKEIHFRWTDLRDYSAKLLKIEPNHVFALVCNSLALSNLESQDPQNRQRSDEALAKAIAIAPNDPEVAMRRAEQAVAGVNREITAAAGTPMTQALQDKIEVARKAAAAILSEAAEKNQKHTKLIIRAAAQLAGMQRMDDSIALLRRAVEQSPEDAELQLHLGAYLSARAVQKEPAPVPDPKKMESEARTHLTRAVTLEPAHYAGYIELSKLEFRGEPNETVSGDELTRRGDAALKILEDAITKTVGLKSVRATLNAVGRAGLYLEAFQTALSFSVNSKKPEERLAAMKRARNVYEQANALYPAWHAVPYMEGQIHRVEGNMTAAIQSLEKANAKYTAGPWMPACELLTLLYADVGQYGEALRYVDIVLNTYDRIGVAPPVLQVAHKCRLLTIVGRTQETLDLAGEALRKWPGDSMLLSAKADALNKLGRTTEAQQELATLANSDSVMLQRARMAASGGDLATAEKILRESLEKNPAQPNVLQLFTAVMVNANRRGEAREFLSGIKSKVTAPENLRSLETLETLLGITDDKLREAKLIEIINANPDAKSRAADLFNYYSQQKNREKTAEALAELERLAPDDPAILERLFLAALDSKEWDKAEKYAATLAKLNADRAKGATFRGQLGLIRGNYEHLKGNVEVARGLFEAAVAAFRDAELVLPVDSTLKVNLAQAMIQLSDRKLEDVAAVVESAIEANPRDFDAHRLLFITYGQMGREEDAIEHLVRASELNPNDPFVQERKQIIEENRDPKSGIARRETLRKEKPEDVENLIRLGQLYAKTKDSVRSQECFDAALKLKPNDFAVGRVAASSLATSGKLEEAERVARHFMETASGQDQIAAHHLLAAMFERFGDQSAALELYRAAETAAAASGVEAKQKAVLRADAAIQMAEFCARVEMVKEMIDAFRRALDQVDPASKDRSQKIRLRIMHGMFVTRRYGDVEKEIDSFLKEYPGDVRGMIERARLLLARSQVEQARTVYTQVLDRDPENAFVLMLRGSVSLDLHKYQDAIADLTKVKRLRPTDFNLQHRLRLAQAYELSGDLEKAELELRELLEARPTDMAAAERLVGLYQRGRRFESAEKLARESLAKQPQSAYWSFQLGHVFMQREEYSAAVEPMSRAAELSRGSRMQYAEATSELLLALTKANRATEAIAIFEGQPNKEQIAPMLRARAAEAYLRTGREADAMAQFGRAVTDAAESGWSAAAGVTRIATAALPAGKAIDFMKGVAAKAGVETRGGLICQVAYAHTLAISRRTEEASKLVDELLARAGDDPAIRVALLEIKAAATSDHEGQAKLYERILNEDEDNVAAINNLAYILADKLNRPKEALKYAERARELIGVDANVLDTLGWVRFQNGDVSGAESALREAIRLDGGNIPAHYHLGRVHAKQGQRDSARKEYATGLALAKKFKDEEHIRLIEQAVGQIQQLIARGPAARGGAAGGSASAGSAMREEVQNEYDRD